MSLLQLTYRKPFKWPYVYIYATPIFFQIFFFSSCGEIGNIATTKHYRKKYAIGKRRVDGLNRVEPASLVCEWGRVGLVPEGCKQGRAGLALRVKNRVGGGSGWSG